MTTWDTPFWTLHLPDRSVWAITVTQQADYLRDGALRWNADAIQHTARGTIMANVKGLTVWKESYTVVLVELVENILMTKPHLERGQFVTVITPTGSVYGVMTRTGRDWGGPEGYEANGTKFSGTTSYGIQFRSMAPTEPLAIAKIIGQIAGGVPHG